MPWVIDYQDKIYTSNTAGGRQVAVDLFVEVTAGVFDDMQRLSSKSYTTPDGVVEQLDLVVRWEEDEEA